MRRSPAAAAAAAALIAVLAAPVRAEDAAATAPAASAAADAAPAPAPDAAPAAAPGAPAPAPADAAPGSAAPPAGEASPATAAAAPTLDPGATATGAQAEAAPDPAAAGSLAAGPDPAASGTLAAAQAPAPDPSAAASVAGAVTAATPAAAPAPAPAEAPRRPWRTLPLIGLSLGAGFPDLANLNLLVRPVNWIRLYGGPSWGYLSWGMQGGVVLSPLNWYITPTLSFQAGKLFRTNAARFVNDGGGDGKVQDFKPLLQRIDYHYYAGDLGLEFGSPRGFNFFLRFGLSFVVVKASGTATHVDSDGTAMSISDPRVSAWLPSAKLGFQYWF